MNQRSMRITLSRDAGLQSIKKKRRVIHHAPSEIL
jgi:hypothetical protein